MKSPIEVIVDQITDKAGVRDENSLSIIKTAFEVMSFHSMVSFIRKIDDSILSVPAKDVLFSTLTQEIEKMRSHLELSDYEFKYGEDGKHAYWVAHLVGSEDFYAIEDAIIDAYKNKLIEDEIHNKMTISP